MASKKEELYNLLTVILDKDFTKDDVHKKIGIQHKLSTDDIEGLECAVAGYFGENLKHIEHVTSDYKFKSEYINIDEETLKRDQYGKIYVDIEAFANTDDLVEALMNNETFIKKISSQFKPTKLAVDFVGAELVKDARFLVLLRDVLNALPTTVDSTTPSDVLFAETNKYISDVVNPQEVQAHIENDPVPHYQQEHPIDPNNGAFNGILEEGETEEYECPICGQRQKTTTIRCSKCGIKVNNWKKLF